MELISATKEIDLKVTDPKIRRILQTAALAGGFVFALAGASVTRADDEKVPLPIKLPKAVFAGTAANTKAGPNVEKISEKRREITLVPKGTVNLALHKKGTSSAAPFSGTLDQITDGDKEAKEDTAVELKPRLQWIQIDLGATSPLSYVVLWHFHLEPIIFHSVVVQASNDPNFVEGVTTLFNNDVEN